MNTFIFLLILLGIFFGGAFVTLVVGKILKKDVETLASVIAIPGVFIFFGLLLTIFG